MIVWTNWFWWLLHAHTSWPVLAWIVLRRIIWGRTTQDPSSCFCVLRLPLGQRLHLLRGTSRGCEVSCSTIIWRTFQNSNLWWGCSRLRVILDYNSSSNRWADRNQAGLLYCLLIYFQFSLEPSLYFPAVRRLLPALCHLFILHVVTERAAGCCFPLLQASHRLSSSRPIHTEDMGRWSELTQTCRELDITSDQNEGWINKP